MSKSLAATVAILIEKHGYDAVRKSIQANKPKGNAGRPAEFDPFDAEAIWLHVELHRQSARKKDRKGLISQAAIAVRKSLGDSLSVSAIRSLHLKIETARKSDAILRARTDRLLAVVIETAGTHRKVAIPRIPFPDNSSDE